LSRLVLGWDVGGANVKAALVGPSPAVCLERPFPLWREPERLAQVLRETAREIGGAEAPMALTLTGELADCFQSLSRGVVFILDAFREAFPEADARVFDLDGRFRSVPEARAEPLSVAAANWLATATFAAKTFPDAILLDVGTTTTDIAALMGGVVTALGRTDRDRLASGELVYTGIARTPVAAIVRSVPLGGRPCRVAAEHFAVSADVYRWLGLLEEADYTAETPDGRGRSREEAGRRIARMVCADLESLSADEISAIAGHVRDAQIRRIAAGIRQVRRQVGGVAPGLAVTAGSGAFLAAAAARRAGFEVRPLAGVIGPDAARVAPAYAVARLLSARGEGSC
jgi:probable H4MPT-linked C1 transfer pathway protein